MGRFKQSIGLLGLCWALTATATEPADPAAAVRQFSDFRQVDVRRLFEGETLAARGALMNFANGISAQTCFATVLPADQTARRLQVWDPAPHESLKVFAFHQVHLPGGPADFQALNFQSREHSSRWLLDKTRATTATRSELNLTRDEARQLANCLPTGAPPEQAGACWAKILLARALLFQQKGLAGTLPYEVAGEPVSPASQLRTMLLEQVPVAHEFAPLLKRIGLLGNEPTTNTPPFYYWSLFDADYHGTLNLGAVYLLPVGDHYQLADLEFYVSSNYYTAVALYEIWPLRVGERTGSLVWRGDFFAAPLLALTKGTERIAYGALMLQDIKREIHCFQDDLKRPSTGDGRNHRE